MGALYLAADTGAFDRKCVVKELLDYYDPSDSEEAAKAQARFETEGRLLAELSHPGIPRIYSYFSESGRHYIVMEYIEGETLELAVTHVDQLGRERAARPLPSEEVVRHAIRVCRVLEYLADQPTPVVHHDVKPANLIIDETSKEVRLVDFGTAQASFLKPTRNPRAKGATTLFGTAGYAAPEQHQGKSEPRSDVYALAATTYHLLTNDDPGDHPFHFPVLDTLPGALADALDRALRLEVGRRSTAKEFRHALEAWLIPEDVAQPFVFGSGAVAHSTEELVSLCDQHWAQARQHLKSGDFDRWFRAQNRHDLVSKAKSARLERDDDAALEAFLRRLNPRLRAPRLTVEPGSLDFGLVGRGANPKRRLTVRNETRGYGQVVLQASVPWLRLEPDAVGCLAGSEVFVIASVDVDALALRRDHQAVLACVPTRGARISIPVTGRLNLVREVLQRAGTALATAGRLTVQGARQGLGLWTKTFRSLLRSRYGPWVLLAETLLLAAVMVALWLSWRSETPTLLVLVRTFLQALPLALVAVYVLPALAFVGGAVVWQTRKAWTDRRRRDAAFGSTERSHEE
jgi:serine/threonine protein kinase